MKTFLILMVLILVLLTLTVACGNEEKRKTHDVSISEGVQQSVMKRANQSVPAYQPEKFPAREDINAYLKETENRNEWYVYALNKEGTPMFYMVSNMQPRNLCTSLTAPERIVDGNYYSEEHDANFWVDDVIMSAPALDGVYYGGTDCGQTQYMIDIATGNFIQISGTQFTLIASKVPLSLETDKLIFGKD